MFYGYCLNPADGSWTPPVTLETAQACYLYCAIHHAYIEEIRITDEEDCIVLHTVHHVLRIPQADESIKELPLTPELLAFIHAQGAP